MKKKALVTCVVLLVLFAIGSYVFAADSCPMCHTTNISQLSTYYGESYVAGYCTLPEHNDPGYCILHYTDTIENWSCNECYYSWGILVDRVIEHQTEPDGP